MHNHDHHDNDHSHDDAHLHDHVDNHDHGHTHDHVHGNAHTHEHAHEHTHAHTHGNEHEADHTNSHDGLLKSKEEAAAFLQYTLSHNAHHEEELSGLVHSLQHLGLDGAAGEAASCIAELSRVNARLDAVLKSLK